MMAKHASSGMKQVPFPFGPPAQRHSPTSVAAAQSVVPKAATYRGQVLETLKKADPAGLTDEEMQDRLSMRGDTQRARRVELVQAGFVADTGQTRNTRSGRKAAVWAITALGKLQ